MKNQSNDLENLIKEYGLEKLDESDQIAVIRMIKSMKDYKKNEKINYSMESTYLATCYTQNYLLLKQQLQQKEEIQECNNKFDQLLEQNEKIIELLTGIKNK